MKLKENNIHSNVNGGYLWIVNTHFLSELVIFVSQYFIMQIFKHTAKLKEFYFFN